MKILSRILFATIFYSCAQNPITTIDNSKSYKPARKEEGIAKSQVISQSGEGKYSLLNKLIQQSDLQSLKKECHNLLLDNTKDLVAMNALGIYYFKSNMYLAAETVFLKALKLNPDSDLLLNNLGVVHFAKGNESEANEYFERAVNKKQKNKISSLNLMSYYLKVLDFEQAIKLSDNLSFQNEADLDFQCQYGIALMSAGNFTESETIFQKVLSKNPQHIMSLLNFSILQIDKNKKFKEGLDLINRLKLVKTPKEIEPIIKTLENQALAGLKLNQRIK